MIATAWLMRSLFIFMTFFFRDAIFLRSLRYSCFQLLFKWPFRLLCPQRTVCHRQMIFHVSTRFFAVLLRSLPPCFRLLSKWSFSLLCQTRSVFSQKKFWLIPKFIRLFIRLPSSSLQKINNFFSGWFFMFQHVFLRSSSSSSIQIAPTSSPPDPQRFIPKFIRLFIRLPSSSFQKIQFPVFLSEWSNIIWEVWKRSLAALRSWISLGD